MPDLRAQQFAFAAHLRDPDANPPPPGIEARRMQVYRELFFNGIASLLGGGFPVIRRTLGEDAWTALVRRFHAGHRSRTPLFTEIPAEFVRFLEQGGVSADDPPWLAELAHYEWIELVVRIDDTPTPAHDPHGDLVSGVPVVAPWARALAYRWPVHRIGPEHRPQHPPPAPTLLLVHRHADGQARFAAISALVHRLLQRLGEGGLTGQAQVRALADEAGALADDDFLASGAAMLQSLRADGAVLGTAPAR